MSLIFEALKKLERERDTTERGFQVIAQTPWPARSRAVRVALLSVAAGALAGAGAWGAWTWLSSRQATVAAPAASASAAQPPARPLPPPIWESTPPSPAPTASSAAPAAAPPGAASAPPTAAAAAPATEPASPAPAAGPAELRLEAISAQDGEPVAVINGQLVRQGDTVEGALVTWIGIDSVELEIDGRRRVLRF